jgi:hypothetical protein
VRIVLFQDSTLDLDLRGIASGISSTAPDIRVTEGKARFALRTPMVSAASSYSRLGDSLLREANKADLAGLFTKLHYDNNFFWQSSGNKSIISLSTWPSLTKVPRNNGAAYFICAILVRALHIGIRHDDSTGCINDFWRDKATVDLGLRSGTICATCAESFKKQGNPQKQHLLSEIQAVLGDIGTASRAGLDICDYWRSKSRPSKFDVFLCHNTKDKATVRKINSWLKRKGVRTWLDEEQLIPGCVWQEQLELDVPKIRAVAVFVGESGIGPWQSVEMRAFLSEFVERHCAVIPVILEDCSNVPSLPIFLKQFMWVDFRNSIPDPFKQLFCGIAGQRPGLVDGQLSADI